MGKNIKNEYISKIAKSVAYFTFKNGPIKDIYEKGKISAEEMIDIKRYMENHLAYLFNVLLEENNLKKFELIINTMDKFYVNDDEEIKLEDDGFDEIYKQIFSSVGNINLKVE